mgnify:CR=1 FL=1
MKNAGLSKDIFDKMNTVFKNYKAIESVLLYGSRAMGNFKPASDIDISIVGEDIDLNLQNIIEFALDDLMVPYKFDVSIYNKITNPTFIDHINRVGVEIYKNEFKLEK